MRIGVEDNTHTHHPSFKPGIIRQLHCLYANRESLRRRRRHTSCSSRQFLIPRPPLTAQLFSQVPTECPWRAAIPLFAFSDFNSYESACRNLACRVCAPLGHSGNAKRERVWKRIYIKCLPVGNPNRASK